MASSKHFPSNLVLLLSVVQIALAADSELGPFRLSGLADRSAGAPSVTESNLDSTLSSNANSSTNSLVWQPLRASFRPLNRPSPPVPPTPPPVPSSPPPPPEPLALVSDAIETSEPRLSSLFSTNLVSSTTSAPVTLAGIDDEDQPTRVPLNRFRPTRPPSSDPQPQPTASLFAASGSQNASNLSAYRISNECFECICEASTSCNVNSRCQTSDVRHTRCGMFLISYDQWVETGLSKQLVTREALARDAAADERAFYECVTNRECGERLLSIYMQKNTKDCDKDGRVDCYDIAAIHQGGVDECNSESLLESQYWSDFNACFGFGR